MFHTIYFNDNDVTLSMMQYAERLCGVDISEVSETAINVYGTRAQAWDVAVMLGLNVEEIAG